MQTIQKEQTLGDLKATFAGGEAKVKAAERQQEEENQSSEPQLGVSDCLGSHTDNPAQPRKSGWPLSIGGEQRTVSSLEQRLKGQYELWVRGNELAAIKEVQETLGPEAAEKLLHKYGEDRNQGHYNFDGKYCRDSLMEMPGAVHLLFILLRRCHPDIEEGEVRRMMLADRKQCGLALRWALGNYYGSVLIGNGTPSTTDKAATEPPTLG